MLAEAGDFFQKPFHALAFFFHLPKAMPFHSMSQRGVPGQLRGSRTFTELFSQRFRLTQCPEQHADWHILLHCALQHFKTAALKELFC